MRRKSELQIEELVLNSGIQSDYVEVPLTRSSFLVLGAVFILVGGLAFGRLLFLNTVRAEFYGDRAFANANKEILVPAPRGIITDRFGEPLVKNESSFSVFVNAFKLLKDRTVHETVFGTLATILGQSRETLDDKLRGADLERQPIRKIAENIGTEAAIKLRALDLPAVQVNDDFARNYIEPQVFSQILGYGDLAGIEGFYNNHLAGVDGRRIARRDAFGNELGEQEVLEAVPGEDIKLTIDADLQRFFYDRLKAALLGLR